MRQIECSVWAVYSLWKQIYISLLQEFKLVWQKKTTEYQILKEMKLKLSLQKFLESVEMCMCCVCYMYQKQSKGNLCNWSVYLFVLYSFVSIMVEPRQVPMDSQFHLTSWLLSLHLTFDFLCWRKTPAFFVVTQHAHIPTRRHTYTHINAHTHSLW